MDSINKFFVLAAGLILTASLILFGFRMADAGKQIGNQSIQSLFDFQSDIEEAELYQYDGVTVSGSDVVNLIKKELSDIAPGEDCPLEIIVKTTTVSTHKNKNSIPDVLNFSHSAYINPMGKFLGKVNRNANGVIHSISFVQN